MDPLKYDISITLCNIRNYIVFISIIPIIIVIIVRLKVEAKFPVRHQGQLTCSLMQYNLKIYTYNLHYVSFGDVFCAPSSSSIQPVMAYYNGNEMPASIASATWPVDKPNSLRDINYPGLSLSNLYSNRGEVMKSYLQPNGPVQMSFSKKKRTATGQAWNGYGFEAIMNAQHLALMGKLRWICCWVFWKILTIQHVKITLFSGFQGRRLRSLQKTR